MSGGVLTDYGRSRIGSVDDWADKIQPENALFAEQLHAIRKVLEAYDLYLAGDISKENMTATWTAYAAKWLDFDSEHIRELMRDILRDVADGIIDGCKTRKEDPAWE